MRIAFSGTHRAGKTTLLEEVSAALPTYETLEEPYELLESDGYEHSDPPALQDFQAQLERSLDALDDVGANVLCDRCPVDVLAYLLTHTDAEDFDLDEWLEPVREAVQRLDLIVFVPIEEPERIALPAHEDARWRRRVHEKLEHLLLEDAYELGVDVLVATGDVRARCAKVLARMTQR